jgi:enamine deaminase RidA (YjgF/YER057c/UK114 family)
MTGTRILSLAGFLTLAQAHPAVAADVIRYKNPKSDFPIAQAVEIPPGLSLVFLSGMGPEIADAAAPKDSPAAYGDTKQQTLSTLKTIEAALKSMNLGMKDVVKMQVFLVGDPAQGSKLDFGGMMESYRQFFGTTDQPNTPARSTVKVAGLANPGWLVEIEVTAARPPK